MSLPSHPRQTVKKRSKDREFTVEDLRAVLAATERLDGHEETWSASQTQYRDLVLLAGTACRPGEALALRRGDIDFNYTVATLGRRLGPGEPRARPRGLGEREIGAMTEEQTYDVVKEYPDFELRWYPEHVVAETRVEGSFEGVGTTSFRRLVGYIGGRNAQSQKVAMTAPVIQEAEDEKAESYIVSFVMPNGLDLHHAPEPTDRDVRLRTIPAQRAAALRFSGRWTRRGYEENAMRLLTALKAAGIEVDGPLRFARFDPPWTPWFRRRNEIVVPVRPATA